VTRPRSTAAVPWALRWLLVAVTVAGTWLWFGGHCADDVVAEPAATTAALTHADHALATVADATPPGVYHAGGPTGDRGGVPDPAFDHCHVTPVTTVIMVLGAAVQPPAGVRTGYLGCRPQPHRSRLMTAVTLATIGVSRT
jgi:hypothetical protein